MEQKNVTLDWEKRLAALVHIDNPEEFFISALKRRPYFSCYRSARGNKLFGCK